MDFKRDALKKIMRDSVRKKLSGLKKELPMGKHEDDEEDEGGSDLTIRIKRMRNA
jgi:hypothetical protein